MNQKVGAPSIYPFILSGGSGTRLWPLSRKSYPKQFLNLTGERSLLQQTVQRLSGPDFHAPSVLANNDHRFIIAEQLQQIGVAPKAIILEPVGRNTAPAALVAALQAEKTDENAVVLLLPSDHVIGDGDRFRKTIVSALEDAKDGHIVTFGVSPNAPETGYGYIETKADRSGDGDNGAASRDVARFVEKPDRATAEKYLASGNFLWNAGVFMYRAKDMIAAFEKHAPTLLKPCREALDKAKADLDFLRLDKAAYEQCENISLDYAVMEKAEGVRCAPLASDWNDLGAWSAIWEVMDKDDKGNVETGDVALHEASNCFAHSTDGACLAVIGLDNVMAIATRDAVLVADRDHAQDVKVIVDQLKAEGRVEAVEHKRVYRPWGWYEQLSDGDRFQVKALMVKPGAQLSDQSHFHRAEHWIVVRGTAEISINENTQLLTENQSAYIPIGARHRLGNPGKLPALLIEVQSGPYLGEDDIVRYNDDFGRHEEE